MKAYIITYAEGKHSLITGNLGGLNSGMFGTASYQEVTCLTDQELEDIKLAAINEYLSALPEEQRVMIDRVSYYRGREDGKVNAEIERKQVAREAMIKGWNEGCKWYVEIDKRDAGRESKEIDKLFHDYWKEKNK